MATMRTFAVVPAAGDSARMGAPKLLLPWGPWTVIEQTIAAWRASDVQHVIVTVRARDAELRRRCETAGAEVVVASPPPHDMKGSVQSALAHLAARFRPAPTDVFLLAPADLPRLSPATIKAVLAVYDPAEPAVVAPTFHGRRGHPTLLPWAFAERIQRLPPHEGINSLVKQALVCEVPWDDDSILRDVDTPRDYAAALAHCAREP
jgi:molybdenum cofactor cytidylyltransferase